MPPKAAPTWFDYWKENMRALGYPIPDSWIATQSAILALTTAIVAAVEKFGTRVTVAELIGAGTLGEELAVFGAANAAFFVGAAIGSAAVATGRTLSGGTSLVDVLEYAMRSRLLTPATRIVLTHNPQIYDDRHPARFAYAQHAAR